MRLEPWETGFVDRSTRRCGLRCPATTDDHWLVDDAGPAGLTGVAYYAPERMSDGVWNLLVLAVHPNRQGQGRGAALVGRVETELPGRARVLLIETSGPGSPIAACCYDASSTDHTLLIPGHGPPRRDVPCLRPVRRVDGADLAAGWLDQKPGRPTRRASSRYAAR